MRDQVAIVERAFDVKRIDAAHIALRDAEMKAETSAGRARKDRETVKERKVELGKELHSVRSQMPARGTKESGWLAFLKSRGIAQQRADECLELYRETLLPESRQPGNSISDYDLNDDSASDRADTDDEGPGPQSEPQPEAAPDRESNRTSWSVAVAKITNKEARAIYALYVIGRQSENPIASKGARVLEKIIPQLKETGNV